MIKKSLSFSDIRHIILHELFVTNVMEYKASKYDGHFTSISLKELKVKHSAGSFCASYWLPVTAYWLQLDWSTDAHIWGNLPWVTLCQQKLILKKQYKEIQGTFPDDRTLARRNFHAQISNVTLDDHCLTRCRRTHTQVLRNSQYDMNNLHEASL